MKEPEEDSGLSCPASCEVTLATTTLVHTIKQVDLKQMSEKVNGHSVKICNLYIHTHISIQVMSYINENEYHQNAVIISVILRTFFKPKVFRLRVSQLENMCGAIDTVSVFTVNLLK